MKKLASVLLIVLSLLMVASAMTVGVGASSAYQTYTYSINGDVLYSPDAYTAVTSLDYVAMGLDKPLTNPKDILTGPDGKVYIADFGNNRVVVLNAHYRFLFEISTFMSGRGGNMDSLKNPQGVFINDTELWVCDSGNQRLVVFNLDGSFNRIIDPPSNELIDSTSFTPIAMAVDQYGRIYVVSSTTTQGIIVLDSDGGFVGFIGAQKVSLSAWQIIWRRFQSKEQEKLSAENVSEPFNNICINETGFIYVTSDSETVRKNTRSAISAKSKDGSKLPVKLLNPAGDEIMRRNGFFPPAGEIDYSSSTADAKKGFTTGVSQVTDVAAGPEKTWTLIDSIRNKLYTYDYNGNLLFAFGDKGDYLGSITKILGITYQGSNLLVLEGGAGDNAARVTVYERTEYGDLVLAAIAAENSLDYSYAIECWEAVLQRNSNFDAAYIGIGNSLYRNKQYEKALAYYEKAYDTENWSQAYKEVRKEAMSTWLIPIIIIIVAVLVGFLKFLGWAAKVNKRVATDGKVRKTFVEELLYGFYVIFHPFDGFYDLKHEHRGSIRAGLVFFGLTVITFFYQGIGQGYVMNPTRTMTSLFAQLLSVGLPLILFVVGNWCLTTLFEGEGSMKHLFIAVSYSLIPLILLNIPATIASNWVTVEEASIVTLVGTVAYVWVGMLLFFGTMITHDYSMGKNLITIIGTIVAMAFIIFIVLLFGMLLSKLIGLVSNIITELQYRA